MQTIFTSDFGTLHRHQRGPGPGPGLVALVVFLSKTWTVSVVQQEPEQYDFERNNMVVVVEAACLI